MGKRIMAAVLALVVLVGTPWGAMAEESVYDLGILTIPLPDDLLVYTRDNFEALLTDTSIVNSHLGYFVFYCYSVPEIYLAARQEERDFDLIVAVQPTEDESEYSKMTDAQMEEEVFPKLLEEQEAFGTKMIEIGVERLSSGLYVYSYASMDYPQATNYVYQYHTIVNWAGGRYNIRIRIATYNHEITDEMVEYLRHAVEGVTFSGD